MATVDKTSALSEGSGSHAPSTKHSDGTVLSSEILIGVVVGGCVLVLVAALAVGAVCYKQKNTPDKRTLVHASSLGKQCLLSMVLGRETLFTQSTVHKTRNISTLHQLIYYLID